MRDEEEGDRLGRRRERDEDQRGRRRSAKRDRRARCRRRREIRRASSAAARPPMFPIARTTPIVAGAEVEHPDRVDEEDREGDVAEEVEERRREHERADPRVGPEVAQALQQLDPHRAAAPRAPAASSCVLIRPRKSAETGEADRVDEDRRRAPSAGRSDTPATPGPAVCEAAMLNCSLAFPSTSCSLRTSDGRYDWYETSKKTVPMPVDEADHVELPDRQRVERVGQRYGGERDGADDVGR